MYENLLPNGSVVLLNGGEKRLMTVGRVTGTSQEIYDYSAVVFPEGLRGSDSLYFFNNSDIVRVDAVGFQDGEEAFFKRNVLSRLGDLEVRDGEIVSRQEPTLGDDDVW